MALLRLVSIKALEGNSGLRLYGYGKVTNARPELGQRAETRCNRSDVGGAACRVNSRVAGDCEDHWNDWRPDVSKIKKSINNPIYVAVTKTGKIEPHFLHSGESVSGRDIVIIDGKSGGIRRVNESDKWFLGIVI